VPFKANTGRRHRIPKQRYRVTNWAEYDAALRQRGCLTVWFSEEAIAAWRAEPRITIVVEVFSNAAEVERAPRPSNKLPLDNIGHREHPGSIDHPYAPATILPLA
jgi:hypothetical protein